jgi:hypothetical protein
MSADTKKVFDFSYIVTQRLCVCVYVCVCMCVITILTNPCIG